MSSYGANMPPAATSAAYQGPMGMPNANMSPNASFPPSPAFTSPVAYVPPMHPMHCGPMNPPVYAAAMHRSSTGTILVLFILLVIISRSFPRL